MEKINIDNTSPVILMILCLIWIIANYDKISLLLPSLERKLENLKKIQSSKCKDAMLNEFVDNQIEVLNFESATGMIKNEQNIKLLNLYNGISSKLGWSDFLKIKEFVIQSNHYEEILFNKAKAKIYLRCIKWVGLFVLGICTFVYIAMRDSNLNATSLLSNLSWSFILFGFSQIMLLYEYSKLKLIKKYNLIIEEAITFQNQEPF